MIRHLLPSILLLVWCSSIYAAQPRVFIQTYATGDDEGLKAESGLGYFESQVFNGLKKDFPCVAINSISTVKTLLNHERQRQLLGTGDENALQNIAGAMGCEYLVCLKIHVQGGTAIITAFCMDSKKAKTLARVTESVPYGDAAIDALEKVADKLIDDLKEYEICPYYGPVTIEVKSEIDDTSTEQGFSNCAGGTATTTITKNMKATTNWNLNKAGLRQGSGTVKFDLKENLETVTQYSCYKCESGTAGQTKITETRESEAKTEGLSSESVSEGKKVNDARIKLVFLDDGTYLVQVEATSEKGILKETNETKVEGACEEESKPKDTKNRSIDVPFKAVFGPYHGTTRDPVLQQKETKDVSNGKEKTTVTIDFTLTRKD